MRILLSICLALVLVNCTSEKKAEKQQPAAVEGEAAKAQPTAQGQVAGLQKMCAESADAIKARQEKETLFKRLGGEEGIRKFSAKLYEAHKGNQQIGHMFKTAAVGPFVEGVTKFLSVNSGGGGTYSGRDMKAVHANMGITNSDFLAAGSDVQSVMKGMGIGENEIQEAVCFLVSFIPTVVTK